jgi:hypothetical protein
MSQLPKSATTRGNSLGTAESVITKADASNELESILSRALELEDIMTAVQPLLHALSQHLYGDDDQPIPLSKLIEDSINLVRTKS